jgi:hypothetical protein
VATGWSMGAAEERFGNVECVGYATERRAIH